MRFAVHAGCVSRAKLLPVMSSRSPAGVGSGQYMRVTSRSRPDFAPTECSTSDGSNSPLSCTRPFVRRTIIRSRGGMTFGPTRRKNSVRENHATPGRKKRGRAIARFCRVPLRPGNRPRLRYVRIDMTTKIGFLSFGHWQDVPGSQVRTGQDALLQTIELAVAAEEVGVSGAYVRVHHFARQLASPFPLLAAMAARTSTIELGTAVIDMRYENPLYMAEEAAIADLISDGRLQLGISRGSPEPALNGSAAFGYVPDEGETDADMARAHANLFRQAIGGAALVRGNP